MLLNKSAVCQNPQKHKFVFYTVSVLTILQYKLKYDKYTSVYGLCISKKELELRILDIY